MAVVYFVGFRIMHDIWKDDTMIASSCSLTTDSFQKYPWRPAPVETRSVGAGRAGIFLERSHGQ